jgi:hypothetical protein
VRGHRKGKRKNRKTNAQSNADQEFASQKPPPICARTGRIQDRFNALVEI